MPLKGTLAFLFPACILWCLNLQGGHDKVDLIMLHSPNGLDTDTQ